jgi:hypothetical protein
MASPGKLPPLDNYNWWADFWRYRIGVNVIPADTKKKAIYEKWSEWQDSPIPEELHNKWKEEGVFSKGIAVILGKVWHNREKSALYLNGIDADNLKAIEEICTYNGKSISLKQLADRTLVEQHQDDTDRAHIYIYSRKPFEKKSSDKTTIESIKKIKSSEIPAIEVKGLGKHGTMFCSSSVHENGSRYEILGTHTPRIADDFEQHIDNICRKHGISYLDGNGNGKSLTSPLSPIEDLFKTDARIYEGHNRHEALLRVMESLIVRNRSILSIYKIQELAREWNNTHCEPPLDDHEFDRQWNDAKRFIDRKNRQEQEGKQRQVSGIIFPTEGKVEEQEEERLAEENKLTTEDIEFVINTIKKEATHDELSIRQLFCGMASAFTKVPISHIVNSKESGAGKSYLLNLVSSYFPNKYVIVLSGMSAKALFHRSGVLVIHNKQTGELESIDPPDKAN